MKEKKGEINGFEINRENEDINLINEDLKSSKIDCYQLNVLSCVEVVDMENVVNFWFVLFLNFHGLHGPIS